MKYACQYAIVRFTPFVETGEFANIGIVLMCPQTRYFDFLLLTRVRRITAFFTPLEAGVYKNAKKNLDKELNRVKQLVCEAMENNGSTAKFLFEELIRPREVLLSFDAMRVVLAEKPEQKLQELFNYYVEREFVMPEYAEATLEKRMRNLLLEAEVRDRYQEARIEHGAFHARFPFAHKIETGEVVKAIKLLHLGHEDASHAYDHGWTWVGKIKQLKNIKVLPRQVLIAAQAPTSENAQSLSVFKQIQDDFENMDVEFIDLTNTKQIKEFVRLQ